MRRILALIVAILVIAPYAAADGMIFIEDRDMWSLQPELNQMGAVYYEDGMENLLLTVSPGADLKGDRAVWIFPVPAEAGKVKIDILKGYPRYTGNNFEDRYSTAVGTATAVSVLYATFPVSIFSGGAAVLSAFIFGMSGNISKSGGIEVYDRVEKMGLTTEVVAAGSADDLNNFLLLRGMGENPQGKELLAGYIGRNYTFVVTSVSNLTAFREASARYPLYNEDYSGMPQANPIGVFVRFPADRIFFPLKPTAVYGTREVPVLLYVNGYTSPQLYDGIRDRTELTYYQEEWYQPYPGLEPFFNGKTSFREMKYTKIKITSPSDRFTDDLWIDPTPPASMAFKEYYLQAQVLVTALAYILFSALASLLAGLLVFRKKAVRARDLLLHGLWNCLTFIGLAVATRNRFPQEEYGKRGYYILAFYVIFGLLFSLYTVLLAPSMLMAVLIGWGIAILSPLLSLALLFMIPMMLGSVYRWNAGSLFFALIIAIIILVLAFIPVPALLLLRRWLDPAPDDQPVSATAISTGLSAAWHRVVPSMGDLADYELRWGRVMAITLAMVVLGAFLQANPAGILLVALGFLGFLAAVLCYASCVFDSPENRDRALAFALIFIPLAWYSAQTVGYTTPAELATLVAASGIIAIIVFGGAILVRHLLVCRLPPAAAPKRPDLRMVLLVLVVTTLLLTPQVMAATGMGNPRANHLVDKGDELTAAGKYPEATRAYEDALRLEPQNAHIYEQMAIMEKKWGSCYQSLDNYEHAVRLAPEDTALRARYEKAVTACGRKLVTK